MVKFRDVLIFVAGAMFLHTISHMMLPYVISLPMTMGFMTLTSGLNLGVIFVSAIITVALLWWASRLD